MAPQKQMPAQKTEKKEEIKIFKLNPKQDLERQLQNIKKQQEKANNVVLGPIILWTEKGIAPVVVCILKEKFRKTSTENLMDEIDGALYKEGLVSRPVSRAAVPAKQAEEKGGEEKKEEGQPAERVRMSRGFEEAQKIAGLQDLSTSGIVAEIGTPAKKEEVSPRKSEHTTIKLAQTGIRAGEFKVIKDDKNKILIFKGQTIEEGGESKVENNDPDYDKNPKGYIVLPIKQNDKVLYRVALGKEYLKGKMEKQGQNYVLSDDAKNEILDDARQHLLRLFHENIRGTIVKTVKEYLDNLHKIQDEKGRWVYTTKK